MGYHLHEKLIEKLEDLKKKKDLSAYKEEKKLSHHRKWRNSSMDEGPS